MVGKTPANTPFSLLFFAVITAATNGRFYDAETMNIDIKHVRRRELAAYLPPEELSKLPSQKRASLRGSGAHATAAVAAAAAAATTTTTTTRTPDENTNSSNNLDNKVSHHFE